MTMSALVLLAVLGVAGSTIYPTAVMAMMHPTAATEAKVRSGD
jgi:hypothetical protein